MQRPMRLASTVVVLGAMLFVISASLVEASRSFTSLIPNGANVQANGQAWPSSGHTSGPNSGNRGDLNQFGSAFKSAGRSWTTALCNADSDGDGFSNGMELGDPNCVWKIGATPTRTTGISHPGDASSVPTIAAAATTTTTTTAAPPTTTTTTTAAPQASTTGTMATPAPTVAPSASAAAVTASPTTSSLTSSPFIVAPVPSTKSTKSKKKKTTSTPHDRTRAATTAAPPAPMPTAAATPQTVAVPRTPTPTLPAATTTLATTSTTTASPPTLPAATTAPAPSTLAPVGSALMTSLVFPVMDGTMGFGWAVRTPATAGADYMIDVTMTGKSTDEYVSVGVSPQLMDGPMIACFVDVSNPAGACLYGWGTGLLVDWRDPSVFLVPVLSVTVKADSSYTIVSRINATGFGVIRGSRQRVTVARGPVIAAAAVLIQHGSSTTERDAAVVDFFAGTLSASDDATLHTIGVIITAAVAGTMLCIGAVMNCIGIVLGCNTTTALRVLVAVVFIALLACYTGLGYGDHKHNLKSAPVGRAFGDAAIFCFWFVLYPIPKHVSVGTATGTSFERLLTYHVYVGLALFVTATVHMGVMLAAVPSSSAASLLVSWTGPNPSLPGFIAWLSLALITISGLLRRWMYALFRWLHLLFLPAIVFSCLHYPKLIFALVPPLLNLLVEAVLRVRSHVVSSPKILSARATPTYVTLGVRIDRLAPTPGPGTFVALGLSASGCVGYPHPVSVAWFDDETRVATFIVKSSGGSSWSGNLHAAAKAAPLQLVGGGVSWQGPYGVLQVPLGTTRTVVLVAGGIGITPVLSILQWLTLRSDGEGVDTVILLWNAADASLVYDIAIGYLQCIARNTNNPHLPYGLPRRVHVELFWSRDPKDAPRPNGFQAIHTRRMNLEVDLTRIMQARKVVGESMTMYCCGPEGLIDDCVAFARSPPATLISSGERVYLHCETFDF